jgi:hypothetical protein
MPDISINFLIQCLTGAAQPGGQDLDHLSPAARRGIAQQLRERIDQNGGSREFDGDTCDDALAEAMRLAGYLDGQMNEDEKVSFEIDLAQSADRRRQLISALAWLDALSAQQISAPAHLIERAIALESSTQATVAAPWPRRIAGFVASLAPRTRRIFATASLTSIVVLAIGLAHVLHQPPVPSTGPAIDVAAVVTDERKEERAGERVAPEQSEREREKDARLAPDPAELERLDQARIEQARLAREQAEGKRLEIERLAREVAKVDTEPAKAAPTTIASIPPAKQSVSRNVVLARVALKRVALVIGNSAYRNATTLLGPASNAAAIATLFKTAGFDVVESRYDLGIVGFRQAIVDFTAASRDADIAVVFYSGHGIEIDGRSYLVPVDAKAAPAFEAKAEVISLDGIIAAMTPARRLRLVILDTWRDYSFNVSTVRATALGAATTVFEPSVDNTLVAFAAKTASAADAGRAANSPFTAALVKHLAEPGLDVRTAMDQVRRELLKETGYIQGLRVSGSLSETVSLVPTQPIEVSRPGRPPNSPTVKLKSTAPVVDRARPGTTPRSVTVRGQRP